MIHKTCSAPLVSPRIDFGYWMDEIRRRALSPDGGFVKTASRVARMFDHKNWLLSHSTIISGVQTEKGDNEKAKFQDHYVHPATRQFVNSNNDCWANGTLTNSYRTFVGADVYAEHVAVPALSKGKILDAVLREIEIRKRPRIVTNYIDILVATNRKFGALVEDVESGRVTGMSMGASLAFTVCTRCGHAAHDEAGLCRHILHEKGDWFIDPRGTKRIIAELCGHPTERNSCVFIEASWVRTPAFKGAIVRANLDVADKAAGEAFNKRIEYAHKVADLRKMITGIVGGVQKAASREAFLR